MSAFLCKKIAFFIRKSTLLKVEIRDFVRDFSVLFSVFVRKKVTTTENVTFADSVSEVRPMGCSKLAKNPVNDNDVTIFWHDVNVKFFDVALFLLSSLVTGPCFMSISSLVLELSQFSFIKDWPEIQKLKISHLSFAQYLETGASYGYVIWHKCL